MNQHDRQEATRSRMPSLSPFQSIEGEALSSVRAFYEYGSLARLGLRFRERLLVISANAEDDSIDLSLRMIGDSDEMDGLVLNQKRPWNEVMGRSFGWGWITVNQQGYCDGILISFGGIVPTLAINVVASSLQVGRIDFDLAQASE